MNLRKAKVSLRTLLICVCVACAGSCGRQESGESSVRNRNTLPAGSRVTLLGVGHKAKGGGQLHLNPVQVNGFRFEGGAVINLRDTFEQQGVWVESVDGKTVKVEGTVIGDSEETGVGSDGEVHQSYSGRMLWIELTTVDDCVVVDEMPRADK
jgi:hypothetical protein